MKRNKLAAVTLILGTSFTALAAEVDTSKLPPPSDQKGVTFDAHVKPILEKACVKCHSGEKPKAKLRLDTLENVLKGAGGEKVLVAGKSAESIIVHSVAHVGDEDHWMPPPKNRDKIPPLTPAQIGLIRAWIDQGAK